MKIVRHKAQKQAFILILASFLVSPLLGMDTSADSKKRPSEGGEASAAKKQKTDKEHKEEIDAKTKEDMSDRLFQVIEHWDSLSDAAIDIPLIKRLLDAKADVNLTDDDDKDTLLHLVIKKKPNREQPAFIKILLDYGCPVNAVNKYGETALAILCDEWEQETYLDDTRKEILDVGKHSASSIKLLMQAGADEKIVDGSGNTAISILRKSCFHNYVERSCEDCGVHHTCIPCGVNQKLLSTIMEHTQYHDRALEEIQKTLEEYHHSKGEWQYLAPIIGYYLAGTAQRPTPDPSSHGSGSGSGSLSLTMEIDQ